MCNMNLKAKKCVLNIFPLLCIMKTILGESSLFSFFFPFYLAIGFASGMWAF